MDFLPIHLNIKDLPCLVVGGGEIAARKVSLLQKAQAKISVISPTLGDSLQKALAQKQIKYIEKSFSASDFNDYHLVIAATDDKATNELVSELAKSKKIPVNVVDNPDLCSFIMPSIIDRSPVVISISTSGASPVLARLLRTKLEGLIPAGYGHLAAFSRRFRDKVKQFITHPADRRSFWEDSLQGNIAERVFTGDIETAEILMNQAIEGHQGQKMGEVYLVGAGPGDPDLLTFKAIRLMQQADVVVYDRLVSEAVLELTRRDAKRIYVGKERSSHALRQEEINQLLAKLAKDGERVVRLKGGDPFIFGRGGEEIDTLAQQGVPFQVVPGITAASGCSAYAGIPLTHRDYAQSVSFVTGHLKDNTTNLNWKHLSEPNQTVVFYMGLQGLPVIIKELIKHGVSEKMPVALVQQGTTELQQVFTGELHNIMATVEKEKPKPPTLIIIGEVVKLQARLSWFKAPEKATYGATSKP